MHKLKELLVAKSCPQLTEMSELREALYTANTLGQCRADLAKDILDQLDQLAKSAFAKGVREGRRLECAGQIEAYARRFGVDDMKVYIDEPVFGELN